MRRALSLCCVALIASCGATQQTPRENLVPVSSIITSMKCAFAKALLNERSKGANNRLQGRLLEGTLTLNVVATQGANGGIYPKAGGPFVFSYAGGSGSFLPSFSRSVSRSNTAETKIDFRYVLKASTDAACRPNGIADTDEYGFSNWLAQTITGLDSAAGYEPIGTVQKIEYTAEFGVEKTTSDSAEINVIFLSAKAGQDSTRKDVQKLTFTIKPSPKGKRNVGNVGQPMTPSDPDIGKLSNDPATE